MVKKKGNKVQSARKLIIHNNHPGSKGNIVGVHMGLREQRDVMNVIKPG